VNGGVAGPAAAPVGCQKPVQPSVLPAARVLALGTHTVGEVLRFDVPAGTRGLSIVSQAVSGVVDTITLGTGAQAFAVPNTVVPTRLLTPGGAVLYDDSAQPPDAGATAAVWYQGVSQSTGSLTLPNTTAALATSRQGYPAGIWSVTVNDYARECLATPGCTGGSAAGRYDVTVLTRPELFTTGTVDLAFYLVTSALTAQQALTDSHVARYLTTLGLLLSRAGLCLGTITFFDVPAWARSRYATGVQADQLGPCDPLKQLFTLSRPGNALHVFLVDAITQSSSGAGDAGVVVGLDGTIPGPASFGGTVQSGVVVNFSDHAAGSGCSGPPNYGGGSPGGLACGADVTAYITAHECGHFLGLYHTTEATGGLEDPLTDTASCGCSAACGVSQAALACCYDPRTGVFAGSCPSHQPTFLFSASCRRNQTTCGGADSLMFWLLDPDSTGTFTDQQAQVVRANPAVR
jgi:hypothetical protein